MSCQQEAQLGERVAQIHSDSEHSFETLKLASEYPEGLSHRRKFPLRDGGP